jgi:hypothetical protein
MDLGDDATRRTLQEDQRSPREAPQHDRGESAGTALGVHEAEPAALVREMRQVGAPGKMGRVRADMALPCRGLRFPAQEVFEGGQEAERQRQGFSADLGGFTVTVFFCKKDDSHVYDNPDGSNHAEVVDWLRKHVPHEAVLTINEFVTVDQD